MKTTILFCLLVFVGCKKRSDLAVTSESRHFVYHIGSGDNVDTAWQEAYYTWITQTLAITAIEKLHYFKYRDRDHLEKATGKKTNGFAEPGTNNFHTIWPIDNHESVHVLVIKYIGHPPALFNEGIAVANHTDPRAGRFYPIWNNVHIDSIARNFKQTSKIPSLNDLLESNSFGKVDQNISYPVAGSFVRYIIETYSIAKFKSFIASLPFGSSASDSRSKFLLIYGLQLDAAWSQWLIQLQ